MVLIYSLLHSGHKLHLLVTARNKRIFWACSLSTLTPWPQRECRVPPLTLWRRTETHSQVRKSWKAHIIYIFTGGFREQNPTWWAAVKCFFLTKRYWFILWDLNTSCDTSWTRLCSFWDCVQLYLHSSKSFLFITCNSLYYRMMMGNFGFSPLLHHYIYPLCSFTFYMSALIETESFSNLLIFTVKPLKVTGARRKNHNSSGCCVFKGSTC